MDVVLALSALAEFVAFLLLAVANEWIRVAYLPAGTRGYALYRAIMATVGTAAMIPVFVVFSAYEGIPPLFWFEVGLAMPLVVRLVLTGLLVVQGLRVWLGLRRVRRMRAEREAKAHAKRNPTWPFGSDRPDPT